MLIEAIERGAIETAKERGDEHFGHVSDLVDCDRAVWARLNGKTFLDFAPQTRIKFALGNATEEYVAELLAASLKGWKLVRNVRVALRIENGAIVGSQIEEDEEPVDGDLVGHVDYVLERYECVQHPGVPWVLNRSSMLIGERKGETWLSCPTCGVNAEPEGNWADAYRVAERVVVEVKSTTFRFSGGRRVIPDEAQYHYRLQAAAYAIALGATRYCVLIVCRESGEIAECWYEADELRGDVAGRTRAVLALGDAPEPPAVPPSYADGRGGNWKCKYCRFAACEANVNPEARVLR